MRTSYNISGTTSGRLSSSAGLFGGTNLQNWTEQLRKIFIPDEGMIFVEADLSQAEARVVAWEAQDDLFKEFFTREKDVHQEVANFIGVERVLAKKLVHGIHYGMQSRTLATHVGCSVAQAELYRQKYFKLFPSVQRWQNHIRAVIQSSRVLYTPLGRKRIFYGRMGEQVFNEGLSAIPQSVVADVTNMGMINLHSTGYDILTQNHDSVLLQVPVETLEEELLKIKDKMTIPITIHGRELVIPVELKVGKNWGDMEKRKC